MVSDAERRTLEEAIVDTVREPLLVLDQALRVVVASRSFYRAFQVTEAETQGRPFDELGNGQWRIPALRTLLEGIIPNHTTIEEYEVEHDFPAIGRRIMRLNARKVFYEGNNSTSLLVAIEDITVQRALELDRERLLGQKDLLLREMSHRVNNSLQIIASILLLKAQRVQSEDTRRHLEDAHERVMAVATVQEQLQALPYGTLIAVRDYLTRLCASLAASMIPEDQPVVLKVEADDGTVTSEQAVSIGLITTELVINGLKHAFPGGAAGTITVTFEATAYAWRLTVSDDGVGMAKGLAEAPVRVGLGTSIVEALARQLRGQVTTDTATPGTSVSITVPVTPSPAA
jgi:two-component sensor histidine kinase